MSITVKRIYNFFEKVLFLMGIVLTGEKEEAIMVFVFYNCKGFLIEKHL